MLRGPSVRRSIDNDFVPVITMGRYGTILKTARPSDDAFVAMFNASKTIIRCALQDIGPPCIPHTKLTLPVSMKLIRYKQNFGFQIMLLLPFSN